MKKLFTYKEKVASILKKNLKMKLTVLFAFTMVIALQANTTNAQRKITLNVKEKPIYSIIDEIEAITEYKFIFNTSVVDLNRKVTLKVKDEKVERVLQTLFYNTTTKFEVVDSKILLSHKIPDAIIKKPQTTITGKVTDALGVPLFGVTVLIKGSKNATSTNDQGVYFINSNSSDNVLIFSSIGFDTQEIIIGKKIEINVKLKEAISFLSEIVLETGYQKISSERATGSFSKITSEDIKEQRPNSLSTILEGRVVGYQNGLLRGTTSMNGLTTPLYVIDGFPIEKTRYTENFSIEEYLPDLNIEDIESITVLKDAAAASIYGARAANGVIVITTKKAKKGKTSVSFSTNLTYSPYNYYTGNLTNSADIVGLEQEWANGNPNLQNSATSAAYASSLLENAVYTSDGMQTLLNFYAGNITNADMKAKLKGLEALNYKFYDDVNKYAKRDKYYLQHNISIGKNTDQNNFNASVTYKSNNYEDIYTQDESVGINLKNSTEISNWLTLDLGTYVYFKKDNEQFYNALSPGYKYQPYNSLFNTNGTPFTSSAESRYNNYTVQSIGDYGLYDMSITPIEELGRNIKNKKSFSSRTFAKLNVKLSSSLTYNAMFQYEYGVDRISQLKDKESYAVRNTVNGLATISSANQAVFNLPYGDILYNSNQFSNGYNFRQQLNFDKLYNDVHDVSIILGTETRHSKLEYSNSTRYGYESQTLSSTPINQQDLLQVYGPIFGGYLSDSDFSTERELINRYVSLFSNAGYTFDRKYTVTGSLRWDRSNLWGTDNKFQNKPVWSAGASWNIDNEEFFKLDWINRLKLRFSHGIGGNIAKDSAPYLTAYYNTNYNVGGLQGGVNSRPNPELSWEKTTTTNIGLDFSLFENRLNGTFDFYNKKGEDLLASTNGIPTEGWGYSTYTINNGEMTNKGIELTIGGTIINTNNFSWDARLLYAYNKNKVSYVDVEAPVYYLQLDYPSSFPRVGNSFNSIYGYKWAGLSSTGLPQVYDASGTAVSYNPGDLEAIEDYGTTVPTQSGSFHTSVSYKNFSLSALLTYQLGHKMRNSFLPMFNNNYSRSAGGYISDIAVVNNRINDRWQQPGDESFTDVPRAVFEYDPEFSYDLRSIYSYADINIIDASNVRLSNVSFAYQIPSDIAAKLHLQNIRLNLNAENVFTIAKSKDAKYMLGGYQSPNIVVGLNVNF